MHDELTVFFDRADHIFFTECFQVILQVFRVNSFHAVEPSAEEEVFTRFRKPEAFIIIRCAEFDISSTLRIDGIKGQVISGQCHDPFIGSLFKLDLIRFFLLFHLGIDDTDTDDEMISVGQHPHDLHIDVHGSAGVDQAVGGCEHPLLIQFLQDLFF